MDGIKKDILSKRIYSSAIIPVVVSLLCLAPFIGKAFHIDDTLFVWAGKHIETNPADFYGFDVNWYHKEMPMSQITKNPPVGCYYIALAGMLFGYSEIDLHTAFLIPAVLAALGTYYLARQFCRQAILAALAAILTPVFLVSSTNVMCDTMMLAFWIWAILFWMRGIKEKKQLSLLLSAVLVAICALTKYFGISLLCLLPAYALFQKRKLGTWILYLVIPIVVLVGYQWITNSLYGRGLLLDAADYATNRRGGHGVELFSKALVGLAFTGGCVATVLFYTGLLWSRRTFLNSVCLMVLFIFAIVVSNLTSSPSQSGDGTKWTFAVQTAVMAMTGVSILWLAVADCWKCRDAESLLLLLWIFGTFIFATFINWSVNGRSILPMIPAVGILLMRRIERRNVSGGSSGPNWRMGWPLIPAAFLAISVCWADYSYANTGRLAASTITKNYENRSGDLWFQRHWGFQYYMEAAGAKPLDFENPVVSKLDVIIIPSNNTNTKLLPKEVVFRERVFTFKPCRWLATMDPLLGAGFYADVWGPLPFIFGAVHPEEYYSFIVKPMKMK